MSSTAPAAVDPAELSAEESRLAQAAAAGDGTAFAALYERYERRAYNLAHRLTGSEDDAADAVQDAFVNVLRRLPSMRGRDLAFGSYLFTATRNASYDLMQKRKRTRPSDEIPESAAPVGSGAGGLGLDPGDPDDDPDRRLLLEAQQEEIRAASLRLPERQREVLALRELEELSYDEIAEIMDMNRNSVAQLISRARIKLRDELRGGALASVAAGSPDCERALPLIAMRDDGQLDEASADAAWLDGHLPGCDTCRLSLEAMQEAGTSYRMWTPVAVAPWLFKETLAKAAAAVGADWSEVIAEGAAERPELASLPGVPRPYLGTQVVERSRRRGLVLASLLGAALLIGGLAAVVSGDDGPSAPAPDPVVETPPPTHETDVATVADDPPEKKRKPRRKQKATAEEGPEVAPAAQAPASTGRIVTDRPARRPAPRRTERRPKRRPRPKQPVDPVVAPEPVPEPTPPTVEEPPPVTDPPPRDPGPNDPPPGGPGDPPPRDPGPIL